MRIGFVALVAVGIAGTSAFAADRGLSPAGAHGAPSAPLRHLDRNVLRAALAGSLSAPADAAAPVTPVELRAPTFSLGLPTHGALVNGVQMPEGPLWRVVEPAKSWGAPEAIASIARAIETVHAADAAAPPLYVGQLSAEHGGYLRPHRSHQSGRDADLGYYYVDGPGWYVRATPKTLDRARTWALVSALAADPNVEAIFMDRSVQLLLRDWALRQGVPKARLDDELFEGVHRGAPRLVRHEWGHLTHLHVRFRCPEATGSARVALTASPGARTRPVL